MIFKTSIYANTPFFVLVGKMVRKIVEGGIELFTLPPLQSEFRHLPFGGHGIQKLINDFDFETVLDIGSGQGLHSNVFLDHGFSVTALDYGDSVYLRKAEGDFRVVPIRGDFNTHNFSNKFDAIWCSHVLEHQLNPHNFLKKIYSILEEQGVLAITVPPYRNTCVGGHVGNWNAGLLLYNLVLAGFDCSDASILKYGFNITVIVTKRQAICNDLSFDSGDLRKIKKFLPPLSFYSNADDDPFNGNIFKLNW